MIKISDVNKSSDLSSGKTKKASSGENFSLYLKESMKSSGPAVGGTSGISVADAIFATQMVHGEEEREMRKKMLKRGNVLIEKLEEIRDGLLTGFISRDKLIDISRFVKEQKFNPNDEALSSLIGEIELRVEVELAKLMK